MIRFDGYYIYEPILYQERKEFLPDYLNTAYFFKNDGYVNIINKWCKTKNDMIFTKEDFLSKDSLIKCVYINNKYFYLHKYIDKPWEEKFYYDRISDKEFVERQTGKLIKFIPWITTDNKVG